MFDDRARSRQSKERLLEKLKWRFGCPVIVGLTVAAILSPLNQGEHHRSVFSASAKASLKCSSEYTADYERTREHIFQPTDKYTLSRVSLWLTNNGSIPATSITVQISIPDGYWICYASSLPSVEWQQKTGDFARLGEDGTRYDKGTAVTRFRIGRIAVDLNVPFMILIARETRTQTDAPPLSLIAYDENRALVNFVAKPTRSK